MVSPEEQQRLAILDPRLNQLASAELESLREAAGRAGRTSENLAIETLIRLRERGEIQQAELQPGVTIATFSGQRIVSGGLIESNVSLPGIGPATVDAQGNVIAIAGRQLFSPVPQSEFVEAPFTPADIPPVQPEVVIQTSDPELVAEVVRESRPGISEREVSRIVQQQAQVERARALTGREVGILPVSPEIVRQAGERRTQRIAAGRRVRRGVTTLGFQEVIFTGLRFDVTEPPVELPRTAAERRILETTQLGRATLAEASRTQRLLSQENRFLVDLTTQEGRGLVGQRLVEPSRFVEQVALRRLGLPPGATQEKTDLDDKDLPETQLKRPAYAFLYHPYIHL